MPLHGCRFLFVLFVLFVSGGINTLIIWQLQKRVERKSRKGRTFCRKTGRYFAKTGLSRAIIGSFPPKTGRYLAKISRFPAPTD